MKEVDLDGEGEVVFKPPTQRELDSKMQTQIEDFSSLLDSLSKLKDKKKRLWQLIFENALQDRKNAFTAFVDLYSQVHSSHEKHAIHGQNISRYLERMSKSTDQLLKLAELVAAAEEKETPDLEEEEKAASIEDEDKLYGAIASRKSNN